MNITVDCRTIGDSGVGVYLRGCLPFFLASSHHFILLGDRETILALGGAKTPRMSNAEFLPCKIKTFSVRELFFFPARLKRKINKADIYYSPFFNIPGGIKIPVYCTIHDVVFPDMPELTSRPGLLVRMFFFRRAVKRSKKVFTVSNFSKSRIQHYFGAAVPVIVTHSALQPFFFEPSAGPCQKSKTIVFIGNIKRHKGLSCLLEAFLLAREEGLSHRLIIIGGKEDFRTSDKELLKKIGGIDASVVEFTGHIDNDTLKRLISRAALLVQPSLYEGFGLPPLEAMILGTRALISDIPVFREIYAGFPVVFFEAGNVIDLKNKLMEQLFNREPETLALSPELSERYSFKKTSDTILKELCLFQKPAF
jgi:glycosyltransferase involved in cell wall biosynthesis